MNCRDLCARIHEWADDELSPDERERVEQHLAGCFPCSRQADAARNLKSLVQHRSTRPQVPESLRGRVLASLDRESARAHRSTWRSLVASPKLRVAAVVLVLVIGVLLRPSWFDRDSRHLAHASVVETSREHHSHYTAGRQQPRWACGSLDDLLALIREKVSPEAELPPWLSEVAVCGVSPYEYEGLTCLQVFCTLDGKPLSLFVLPSVPTRVQQKRICWCAGKKDGERYLIYCWATGGVYYSMVVERTRQNLQRFDRGN